jgi:hypothetical protein
MSRHLRVVGVAGISEIEAAWRSLAISLSEIQACPGDRDPSDVLAAHRHPAAALL